MKKHWKKISILAIILIALSFVGCKKPDLNKIAGGTWNPNLAIPIGHSEFGVYEILAAKDSNDLIVINDITGEMALNYRGELLSISAQSLLQLNNYSQTYNLVNSDLGLVTSPSFNGSISSNNSQPINFPVSGGSTLNTVNLESGNMTININTTLQQNIDLVVSFPDILLNNSPVTKNISINYNGTIPQISNSTVNLANTTCDFTANGTATNTLRMNVNATVNGTNQPIIGNENFDITIGLNNLAFLNATGYFGQQSLINSSDSILIKIFNNASSGVFNLTNPKINFKIENSFGIPVQMDITNLKSINTITNSTTNISNPNLTNLTITAPSTLGQTSITTIPELNNTNTAGINNLVSSTPKYFNYTVNASTNPSGPALNFIDKNSKMIIKADLELPLEGNAYDFGITDTLPFNFSQDAEIVESVMFRLNSTNGFPINFETEAFVVDSNYVPLFNLFGSQIEVLSAAPVNSSGKVTSSVNKINDITLTRSKIELLDKAKYIIITGKAATTQPYNTTTVKIFDDYKLALKLGLQVILKQDF